MFRYYNAHPYKRSVEDCVKRSIALTTGIPYRDVQHGLNAHKKITGAKRFNQNENPRSFVEKVLGFPCVTAPRRADGRRDCVADFARSHPTGRYILSVSGHWTACIDGVIYDTWDCSDEGMLSYYEITRFTRTKVERKYCFTTEWDSEGRARVTVYDGNGTSASKQLSKEAACEYADSLYARGFFNFDEMGEYI